MPVLVRGAHRRHRLVDHQHAAPVAKRRLQARGAAHHRSLEQRV